MMGIEERVLNIIWSRSGSGSPTTKLSIPIWWLHRMGITKDHREVIATYNYDTEEIIIKKHNV